jgi:hypothetical protein
LELFNPPLSLHPASKKKQQKQVNSDAFSGLFSTHATPSDLTSGSCTPGSSFPMFTGISVEFQFSSYVLRQAAHCG